MKRIAMMLVATGIAGAATAHDRPEPDRVLRHRGHGARGARSSPATAASRR